MKEMEFWMQTVEGRSDAKQRISKIHFSFYDKNSLSNV